MPTQPYSRCLGVLLVTLAVSVLSPASGQAFFFFAWPGELSTQARTLIPPGEDSLANPPSARRQDAEKSPSEQPANESPPDPPTPLVPEPGTAVMSGIGVLMIGTVHWWKRRKSK